MRMRIACGRERLEIGRRDNLSRHAVQLQIEELATPPDWRLPLRTVMRCEGAAVRSAKVYRRNDQCLIHADCKTTAGVWIASPPFLISDDDPLTIGTCISEALQASIEGVPHPTQWNNLFRPVLELAGVMSWKAFVKGAVLVGVESDAGETTLTPHRTLGPKGGFEAMQTGVVRLAVNASTETLGAALNEVARRCTSAV